MTDYTMGGFHILDEVFPRIPLKIEPRIIITLGYTYRLDPHQFRTTWHGSVKDFVERTLKEQMRQKILSEIAKYTDPVPGPVQWYADDQADGSLIYTMQQAFHVHEAEYEYAHGTHITQQDEDIIGFLELLT